MRARFAILSLLLTGTACAQTTQPANVVSSTEPATIPTSTGIDTILDALDARGQNLTDFTAKVELTDTNLSTGASTVDDGKAIFQRKGPGDGRIRVIFDSHTEPNGTSVKENHDYVLDNGWLIERDYIKKNEDRKQVLRPGEKMDLLKLGEGPFPLPIGQKKEDVKKLFDVTIAPLAKDDPSGTFHLILTPKPNSRYSKYKEVEIFVDTANNMPRRIQTEDKQQTGLKTTDLTDMKLNTGLTDKDFKLDDLPKTGWNTTEEPFQER